MHATHTPPTSTPAETTPTPAEATPVEAVPADPTPADILRAAVLYLERYGWHRGTFYADEYVPPSQRTNPFPPACAIGAIDAVVTGRRSDRWELRNHPEQLAMANRALCVLAEHLGIDIDESDLVYEVGCWNDATFVSDVTACLHEAAAVWDQRHGHAPATHAGYPHEPGTLYDCPACEARCYCTDDTCVYCALAADTAMHTSGGAS